MRHYPELSDLLTLDAQCAMVGGDGEGAQLVLGGAGDLHPSSGPADLQPRHGLVSVHLERILYYD